jgi:hypothetical protein
LQFFFFLFFCSLMPLSWVENYCVFKKINCISNINHLTIRILLKFSKPSGVKSGVPSSMNDKSVKYIPKYGIHGGSQRCNASRITLNRPSEHTTACSLVIVCFICKKTKKKRCTTQKWKSYKTVNHNDIINLLNVYPRKFILAGTHKHVHTHTSTQGSLISVLSYQNAITPYKHHLSFSRY